MIILKKINNEEKPQKKKKCNRCKNDKSIRDFRVQGRNGDNRSPTCRPCEKELRLEKKAKAEEQNKNYKKKYFDF